MSAFQQKNYKAYLKEKKTQFEETEQAAEPQNQTPIWQGCGNDQTVGLK